MIITITTIMMMAMMMMTTTTTMMMMAMMMMTTTTTTKTTTTTMMISKLQFFSFLQTRFTTHWLVKNIKRSLRIELLLSIFYHNFRSANTVT